MTTAAAAWLDERWRVDAHSWIRDTLADLGAAVIGEITQPHVRPWSTAVRVPTSAGTVWFKANGEATAHEPPLLAVLGRWAPDSIVVPLAVDVERRWSLSPDGGRPLRAVLAADRDLARWEQALPAYGQLQRALAPHAAELLEFGVPDLRAGRMPGHLAWLLDQRPALLIGQPDGLTEEQYAALRALQPEYAAWCAELAVTGIEPSLQHDDLHDNNVLVGDDGRYRFFDWGDASVAHPFASLLVTLRSIRYRFELSRGAPELHRLRDAYFEPWTAEHDRASLLRAAELATKVAKVSRALCWERVLRSVGPDAPAEHADAVPGWLAELIEPDLP